MNEFFSLLSLQRNFFKCRLWFAVSLFFLGLFVLSKLINIGTILVVAFAAEGISGGAILFAIMKEIGGLIFGIAIQGYQLWVRHHCIIYFPFTHFPLYISSSILTLGCLCFYGRGEAGAEQFIPARRWCGALSIPCWRQSASIRTRGLRALCSVTKCFRVVSAEASLSSSFVRG